MFVVTHRKIFFILSAVIVGASLLSMAIFGLQFGIDFTGGAITEVSYPVERPDKAAIEERLNNLAIGSYSLRPTGEEGFILRTRDLSEEERQAVLETLSLQGTTEVVQERFNSIGPVIGEELK